MYCGIQACQRFNPKTKDWDKLDNMGTRRRGGSLSKIVEDGKEILLMTGGTNGTGSTSAITDDFQIFEDWKWKTKSSTLSLYNHCQAGKWIFGGINEEGDKSNAVYKLDDDYNWVWYSNLTNPRSNCGATKTISGWGSTEYYYVVGGGADKSIEQFYTYDNNFYKNDYYIAKLPDELNGHALYFISPFQYNGTLHIFTRYGNIFKLHEEWSDPYWEKVKFQDEGLNLNHKILIIKQNHIFGP